MNSNNYYTKKTKQNIHPYILLNNNNLHLIRHMVSVPKKGLSETGEPDDCSPMPDAVDKKKGRIAAAPGNPTALPAGKVILNLSVLVHGNPHREEGAVNEDE
jgi:hypothetical protein